ncbi:TPA: hypothetical protein ACJIWW_000929 [Enterobacter asburiae]
MSIKNLVEMIKHNGLLSSMSQLEKLYQAAIENEQKLAELEAHLAALAAENAGLKAAGNKMFLSAISLMEDPELKIDHARDIKDWERIKTPATGAFLDEVRAQSVEMFAKEMHADISGDDAREFAAQLRKGVQS